MSTKSSSESYGGCGNVSNLGNYTNSADDKSTQLYKNREDLLNTLVKGSPTPNNIKKCSELISSDKKKGNPKKSED
jgi:hypothetical protein